MPRTAIVAAIWLIGCVVSVPTQAAPPAPGTEQSELLAPFGDWVRGLANPQTQQACCDLSDCRIVNARQKGDHYQAFISREDYGDNAPDDWLDVPSEVVITDGQNPIGLPIACWRAARRPVQNGFFCFRDGSSS